jgi:hypothetical protein
MPQAKKRKVVSELRAGVIRITVPEDTDEVELVDENGNVIARFPMKKEADNAESEEA